MKLGELYKEIEHLPPADLDELAARVAVLRKLRSPGYAKEMSRRRDDQGPSSWMTLESLKI